MSDGLLKGFRVRNHHAAPDPQKQLKLNGDGSIMGVVRGHKMECMYITKPCRLARLVCAVVMMPHESHDSSSGLAVADESHDSNSGRHRHTDKRTKF
jgi:hypothetical protein